MNSKKLFALLVVLCTTLAPTNCPSAQAVAVERTYGGDSGKRGASDAHRRLKEVEKNHKQVLEKLRQAREKENQALAKLRNIKKTLNATNNQLDKTQHQLQYTEVNIQSTEKNLSVTQTQEEKCSDEAAQRLREIYEGQRLGLLEMAFQVRSLQALLDLFYYQERIAAADRIVLADLRAKASALASKRNQLGSQKNVLGDMVSEFAKKALLLSKEKTEQEKTADKMRTQRAFYEQAERQLAGESLALEQQIIAMVKASSHNSGGKGMQVGSGSMQMPLRAPVTSPFGWRRHPIFGLRKFHTGVDLAGPNRSAIVAADSGNVLYSGWYGGYGKVVIVSHGKGMATLYAHLSKGAVSAGENVKKGQVIGYEGSTGFSTGPHLHFEVRVDGKPNNPLGFVR